jgi:hypothetical protein
MAVIDHKDVRVFFSEVAEHTCEARHIVRRDTQGTTVPSTSLGFACTGCGTVHVLGLAFVKCMRKPLRPYIRTTADREITAERLNREPAVILSEMRNSGGWDQGDPGIAFFTMLAAAAGPPGNPMEKKIEELIAPLPKPH